MKRGLVFLIIALALLALPMAGYSASMTDEAVLGNNRWSVQNDGDFIPNADSSYDIGAVGSEVDNIYVDDLYVNQARLTRALLTTGTTIPVNNTAPDVSSGTVFITSVNTQATTISDLTNPVAGQIVYLIGGSSTVPSYVEDSGNFNLSAQISLNLDDVLILFVQADNDYIEIGRINN
ncbi:MAG TPA: hypothetical protein DCL42_04940 [Deltaproteobacteria bacterium]|nr:hypothetical protein [Deltaproteobacteria bacterium]